MIAHHSSSSCTHHLSFKDIKVPSFEVLELLFSVVQTRWAPPSTMRVDSTCLEMVTLQVPTSQNRKESGTTSIAMAMDMEMTGGEDIGTDSGNQSRMDMSKDVGSDVNIGDEHKGEESIGIQFRRRLRSGVSWATGLRIRVDDMREGI
jgi:hypothetical protein